MNFKKNELKSVIVMKLPDVMKILQEPLSDETIIEIEKLIVLILGCAVQVNFDQHIFKTFFFVLVCFFVYLKIYI